MFILRRFIEALAIPLMLAFSALFIANATAQSQSSPAPRGDNQFWSETQLSVPINNRADLVLLGFARFGRNVSRPVNERVGAGILVRCGKYLTLLPSYLYVASQPTSINHSTEHRITLEATPKFPIRSFVVSDRNRVEFHFHSPSPNFVQYRNRMQIEHALPLHDLHGFVADEVFYDSATLEIYYVRQNDGHSHPGDINALGSTFKIRL
ncbi:MAG: hypothetical protein DMF75_21715 [Acidobacteria bacterium]|nr:MAG: hypothetical protein DMF75_21715 [Acidobacteriota bacterium]